MSELEVDNDLEESDDAEMEVEEIPIETAIPDYKALFEKERERAKTYKARLGGHAKAGKQAQTRQAAIEEDAVTKATAARDSYWKTQLIAAKAEAALSHKGVRGNPSRIARLLDLSQVDVTDSGQVEGLDEAIEELEEESPEFFTANDASPTKGSGQRPNGTADGGTRGAAPSKRKDPFTLAAEARFGKR